jgi:hypothetical protein
MIDQRSNLTPANSPPTHPLCAMIPLSRMMDEYLMTHAGLQWVWSNS